MLGRRAELSADVSTEVERIVEALRADGLATEAQRLRDVVAGGATGTEILMGLRYELLALSRAGRVSDRATRRKMRRLAGQASRLLRG